MKRWGILAACALVATVAHAKSVTVSLIEQAEQHYKAGEWQKSIDAYEEALTHHTSKVQKREIYLYLGKNYESMNRPDKALAAYEAAAQYDKNNWRRHRDLGQLYEMVKLYREAVAAYETALSLRSNEPSVLFSLGRTRAKMGLNSEAEAELKKSLELGHDQEAVAREMARVYEGMGRYSDAAQSYRSGVRAPANAEEAARLIYLASLGHDKELVKTGFEQLKTFKVDENIVKFYAALAVYADASKPAAELLSSGNAELDEILKGVINTQP